MELAQIIGQNLKNYRNRFGFTQDHIAHFLGVDRTAISHYENAEREISMLHLNKLTDLFNVELEDLIQPNSQVSANIAFAFRTEGIQEKDLGSIAAFQKVVKNYIQMKRLASEQE